MRILLTNDDGIRAPGIEALHGALTGADDAFDGPLGDVWTVAPLTAQSATGHGVTISAPLTVRPAEKIVGFEGYAVDGRPADCVKLAVSALWQERYGEGTVPDLVVSGMNHGANCGINVVYSGTVAAALEAAICGIPSIAVSLHLGPGEPDFALGARWARRAIQRLLAGDPDDAKPESTGAVALPPHACLNVNIPRTDAEAPAVQSDEEPPLRVRPMNTHGLVDSYERRSSPAGDAYYWATGYGLDFRGVEPETDVEMLLCGCVTVTPLQYDLTARGTQGRWRQRVEGRA